MSTVPLPPPVHPVYITALAGLLAALILALAFTYPPWHRRGSIRRCSLLTKGVKEEAMLPAFASCLLRRGYTLNTSTGEVH